MTNYKKVIFTIFLAFFAFTGIVTPQPADAFSPGVVAVNGAKWAWEKIGKVVTVIKQSVSKELGLRTLNVFLDNLAYEVATELATGGQGGKPLFRTESITKGLQKSRDAALGDFVGELTSKGFGELGINLCDPSIELKLTLTLGLIDEKKPPRPKCNWNKIQKNWADFGQKTQSAVIKYQLNTKKSGAATTIDFFKGIVSDESSDLGIFLSLNKKLTKIESDKKEERLLKAIECKGYKDKATTLSKEVVAKCTEQESLAKSLTETASIIAADNERDKTKAATNLKLSTILKSAGNRFVNTFTSKMLKGLLKSGSWSLFGREENKNLRDDLIYRLRGGSDIRQPRGVDIFKQLKTINVEALESFEYISDFTICPNQFRSPDNCVMSPAFLQAVNSKLTVQQAIDQGILDANMPFIEPADAINHTIDKCYRDGLCYSNLVKLRKANMISVGWELAALRAPVSLQQAIDCFEESKDCSFDVSAETAVDGKKHNPFYHLVDPNWVLKAPAVRCEAYSFSSILASSDASARQQYCADPKICLREDENGNCLEDQFNYCTRSENIWNFEGESCTDGEIYAGCLTFTNKNFGDNSYIQDTLEYCTADQAGCSRYSRDKNGAGDWVLGDIAIDTNDLFLNDQAIECTAEQAGCSEYIVLAPGTNSNLIPNGSFDDLDGDNFPDGWSGDGIDDPNGIGLIYDGDRVPNGYSYDVPRYLTTENVNMRINLQPNTMYRLSGEAAQYDSSRADSARIAIQMCDKNGFCSNNTSLAAAVDNIGTCDLASGGNSHIVAIPPFAPPPDLSMERRDCTFMTNNQVSYAFVNLLSSSGSSAAIWFDNIKLESIATIDSGNGVYSNYGEGAKIYTNSNTVMCIADEVGCQGYTPSNEDPMIPAVITQGDLCPNECVGYATFTEQPNIFDTIEDAANNPPAEYYNFIVDTAQQCPDQEVGCEEFTNLDVVSEGGEGREYFTYLRQCVEESLGTVYYTWEGTDVAGYQIKTWNTLESNIVNSIGAYAPCTNVLPGGNTCQDTAVNMAACGPETADPNDGPENDPNCREFFDINGDVHYRLQDRVIFATNNCNDYRRAVSDQVYKAVPEESAQCAAVNNGCSSYYGNNANNIRTVFSDNFEQGTYSPWTGSIDLSNESLNNNGHSLAAITGNAFARDMLGVSLQDNKEYTVSWWMKSEATIDELTMEFIAVDSNIPAGSFQIKLIDSDIDNSFKNIEAGRWHYYTTSAYFQGLDAVDLDNLIFSTITIYADTVLGGQALYIDNFIVKEAENSFSVIRNSWDTPLSCDTPYEGYYLGCQLYTDLNGQDFNLKSFDHLCREEAIGCVPVIDTNNSDNPLEEEFNVGDYSSTIVAADSITYLVPNPNNYCPQSVKGCTELGLADRLDSTEFSTIYKINDPDEYDSILCNSEGLSCSEYNTDKGIFYLKDPGANTCTYQQNILIDNSLLSGWFKTSTLGDNVPLGCADTDNNTDTNGDGLYDVGELILPRDYCTDPNNNDVLLNFFTKNDCESNNGDWNNYLIAAQCPASENLCTSFKDPADPVNCDPKGRNIDFVDYDGFCVNNIDTNQVDCEASLPNGSSDWIFPSRDGYCDNNIYNNERDCTNQGLNWTPYCKDYFYYDNENIDESSCNGLVDRQNGCVLFNDINNWNGEHSQIISSYDTDETYEDIEVGNRAVSPINCDPSFDPSCNLSSNRLIKVSSDRQCSEWLACKSSTASLIPGTTNEYKIICDDLATCIEFQYDPDSNTTKCKKWGSYDDDVEALTFEKYQSRATGLKNHISWSDKEYTGYSIPDTLPVSELSVYDFVDGDEKITRLVYNVTDSVDRGGAYYKGCVEFDTLTNTRTSLDGEDCTATINTDGDYRFIGKCQESVCWVSPKVNQSAISYGIETRAYSVADAPFPAAIESKGVQRLSKYAEANICNNDSASPDACEDSFKKVTYGAGQDVLYYPEDVADGDVLTGICVSGLTTDKDSAGNQVPRECLTNQKCDSKNSDNTSRGDGFCTLVTEEIIFKNWPGICLEYDFSNPIVKDGDASYYCNQWYPAQKIRGTASLYDNYRAAGYFDANGRDALFCALAEPYVTTEDRFYCGAFTEAGDSGICNVLLKIPAGSRVNLDSVGTDEYSSLLNVGSWLEDTNANLVVFDSEVDKNIIRGPGNSKFSRSDFANILPNVTDFMTILQDMFDTTIAANPGIHRFYWDEDVAANGFLSGNSYVALLNRADAYHWLGDKDTCPVYLDTLRCPTGLNTHIVYERCWEGSKRGLFGPRWKNGSIICNPLTYNYYVDLNTGANIAIPEDTFVGSCGEDCKFTNITTTDSNHGIGCLQNNIMAPVYSNILSTYASSTLASNFDKPLCDASITDNNDCAFVNCIQNLELLDSAGNIITDQSVSQSCNQYNNCFQFITDVNEVVIASNNLYLEVVSCFSDGDTDADPTTPKIGYNNDGVGPSKIYDSSAYDQCIIDNKASFTNFGRVDDSGLAVFCSTCSLLKYDETYKTVSFGVDCTIGGSINCYQQCRVVTQLDSEGLLSAVRTDIWWRNEESRNRVNQASPWVSWYWNSSDAYVTSTPRDSNGNPNAGDDEVLYHSIAGLAEVPDSGYPNNFNAFGAGLDIFRLDSIVSTRVPYYRVSPDNITSGTFFGYYDENSAIDSDSALNNALTEMNGLFNRVYNLEWNTSLGLYEAITPDAKLDAGNNFNSFAGQEYSPRILATCGDRLCETLDVDGNVISVEEGITVNDINSGNLVGLNGSLFVSTKFFYQAHPDHMPVYSIGVDWGDEASVSFSLNQGKYKNSLPAEYCKPNAKAPGLDSEMGFAGTEDACQTGYKIFYHDYLYDSTQGHPCNNATIGTVIPNASCYQPSIKIFDNWRWSTTMPFDGWIVVYNE